METLDKILTLLAAGYTREEISALLGTPASGAGDPANADGINNAGDAPVPPAPAAPAGGEPVSAAAVNPAAGADVSGIYAALEQMSKNIVAAIQKVQIGGTQVPAPADPMAQIDAITAQIINPTYKKGE